MNIGIVWIICLMFADGGITCGAADAVAGPFATLSEPLKTEDDCLEVLNIMMDKFPRPTNGKRGRSMIGGYCAKGILNENAYE